MDALEEYLTGGKVNARPAGFPRVEPEIQKSRDAGAQKIKEQELTLERSNLANAKTDEAKRIAQSNIDSLVSEMGGKPAAKSSDVLESYLTETPTEPKQSNVAAIASKTVAKKDSNLPTPDVLYEVPRALIQNTAAQIAGGYAGIAGSLLPGPAGQGAKWSEKVQQKLGGYEPPSAAGKSVMNVLAAPAEYVISPTAEAVGGAVANVSPAAGAIVKGAIEAAPLALGLSKVKAKPVGVTKELAPGSEISPLDVPTVMRQQFQTKRGEVPAPRGTQTFSEMQAALEQKRLEAQGVKPAAEVPVEPEIPVMPGLGAASVEEGRLRQERAHQLLIPIDLTKDIISRKHEDVQYAREMAKNPTFGAPLREAYTEINSRLQRNLQAEVEATGATQQGVAAEQIGQQALSVVEKRKAERKAEVRADYLNAEKAGELAAPVSYQPVLDYLNKVTENRPTRKASNPILAIVEEELKANDPSKSGKISLGALEDIRQLIIDETDPTQKGNLYHGKKMKDAIDKATENAGGELYKKARANHSNFMSEFENQSAVRDITRLKKGTTDRAVALENMVEHMTAKGTLADTKAIFSTLEKAGPEGRQLISELRGQLADKIMEESSKNIALDERGKPYVSADKLNKIIKKLDKSGKLEFIFGKEQANRYRTLNDVARDVLTVPAGAVNTSGTASVLGAMAETGAQFAATGIPIPIVSIAKQGHKLIKERAIKKKVQEYATPIKDMAK
jgi:hypothetical protein